MAHALAPILPAVAVIEACRLMQRQRIRHLLVVQRGRLVGIATETDFLRAFVASGSLAVR